MSAPAEREKEFVLTDGDFRQIAEFIQTQTGIQLPAQKKNLVYSRLARRLREMKLDSFKQYLDYLNTKDDGQESMRMINALTTNHTKFFREDHHFEHLAKVTLPAIAARGQKKMRLWSAGCSLGAEPYTMAIVIQETLPDIARWDAKILATDLDTDVLTRARNGVYSADCRGDIPKKYFQAPVNLGTDSNGQIVMPDTLKNLMRFKRLNFLHQWPIRVRFDAIFCRNVLIYFDRPTQDDLFTRFANHVVPGGYLYIGHSETIRGMEDIWKPCGKTIYQRVGS